MRFPATRPWKRLTAGVASPLQMGDTTRARCVCCGKHRDEVGVLSWQGLCGPCGLLLLEENVIGIAAKSGPAHRRRLRGYAKWLTRELVDEPAEHA